MVKQPASVASRSAGVLKPLGWLLFGLSVILVIIAVVLPPEVLSWLRSNFRLFGEPLNWLEMTSSRIDLTHVILFG